MIRRERIIEDILRLLACCSVTGDMAGIRKCQEVVSKIAEKMGFNTEVVACDKVVIISPNDLVKPAKLGVIVHLDTVSFNECDWNYSPLGEVVDGRIYGRGIIDDKGPIVLAMHVFDELQGEIQNSWQIIIGSDEEGSWSDMENLLRENISLPEFLVTIDGDGVQNGCRGYLDINLKFKRKENGIIQNLFVLNGSNNTLPATCTLKLRDGRIIYGKGKEVHSSLCSQGRSAITELSTHVTDDIYEEYEDFFTLLKLLDGICDGRVIGIDASEVSATNVYLDENDLNLNLNVRMEKDIGKDTLKSILTNLEVMYHCKAEAKEFIRPSSVDANLSQIHAMKKAYEIVIGRRAEVTIAKGVGYNAALPNCAIFGPRFEPKDDEEDMCHQANESRSLEDIFKFYEMLKIFVKEVL